MALKNTTILSLVFIFTTFLQAQQSFDINQAIEYALENNKSLLNAKLQEKDAQARVNEIIATGLPQVNLALNIYDYLKIPTSVLPANAFDPNAPGDEFVAVEFGTQFQGSLNINAQQMIFDGSFFTGLKVSNTYKDLISKDHIRTEQDIIENTLKAFYIILINKERLELANQNIATLEKTLDETIVMHENGYSEKTDVDRIKVQLNNVKTEQKDLDKDLELSYIFLKFQIGMSVKETLEIQGNLKEFDFSYEENEINSFVYNNRVEIQQMELQKEMAVLDLKLVYSDRLPKLYLQAGYGNILGTSEFDQVWNTSNWYDNYFIGASLTIPIFNGFSRDHSIQRKKIAIKTIENQRFDLENSIDRELFSARKTLQNSIEKLDVQKQNLELAEEVYENVREQYKNGISSNIELLNTETSYRDSEVLYYSAMYEVLVSKIDLDKALGNLEKYKNKE